MKWNFTHTYIRGIAIPSNNIVGRANRNYRNKINIVFPRVHTHMYMGIRANENGASGFIFFYNSPDNTRADRSRRSKSRTRVNIRKQILVSEIL